MPQTLNRFSPAVASMAAECPDMSALRLVLAGKDWSGAVERATHALRTPPCRTEPACLVRAFAVFVYAGQLTLADELAEPLRRTATDAPALADTIVLLNGRLAGRRGDLDGALDAYQKLGRSAADPTLRLLAAAAATELAAQREDPDLAAALITGSELEAALRAGVTCAPFLRIGRAAMHRCNGNFGAALSDYLDAGRKFGARGIRGPAVSCWRSNAALCAHATGRQRLATVLARQAYTAASGWAEPYALGRATFVLGVVDGGSARTDLFSDAAELFEIARAPAEQGAVLYELGCRLAADRPAAARQRLERARGLFVAVGNGVRAARADDQLRRLPTRSPTGRLSVMEVKAVRLAAAGYTNRQIANKLFLAVRTVEAHLSRAYAKLGIAGREDLAWSAAPIRSVRP
ncbi:helix-turn-helix transcriptional regulator [Fodinicola feengrottensis]|uniref:helix-turn-helix transcriptional regulator n=1 Tax=Fodinicola feengrottensis TaxID=435914 RepID=UPI0031E3E6D7